MKSEHLQFPLLSRIDNPAQLRQLNSAELVQLASELRAYMVYALNQCGGHFAGNLGTVELTIALHYVYNTPYDRLVWDVGHQAYPHKVLTGRRDRLNTIRQTNGLAPFLTPAESEYDTVMGGHASTAISTAAGMAVAAQMEQSQRKAVAIIGDGGLTGGMAFEALNHIGHLKTNLLVILNDNEMSISRNVGALTNYLAKLLTSRPLASFREHSKEVLKKVPPVRELLKRTEAHVKGMITSSTLFEELGFNYIGPVDGHDLPTLIETLKNIKHLPGPYLLHAITVKGKGYAPAEADPIGYHAVKPGFNNPKVTTAAPKAHKPTYSEIFGDWLCDMAEQDSKLVGITPAMCEGSGMVEFAKRFPERYYDVGIAEQHSVTFASGLACEGKKPVVAIYSTFLQRAYDQLIHDVALQNLDVTFALDRGSLVTDGPTHAGIFDLSYLRCIPNMVVVAPSDENECRQLLYTAYQYQGPAAVRYPRGNGVGAVVEKTMQGLPIGKAVIRREGKRVAILAFGVMLHTALKAAEVLNATVVDMRFIKPLDTTLITELARTHELLVTIEENVVMGGAGSAVNECLAQQNCSHAILNLGLPDQFPPHGEPEDYLAKIGLDDKAVVHAIDQRLKTFINS